MCFTSITPVFTQLAGQTIPGSLTVSGNLRMNGGADVFGLPVVTHSGGGGFTTNSEAAAGVLTPVFANGVAAQLADTGRDYMVYLTCTTAGTAFSLAIGPTAAPAHSLLSGLAISAGQVFAFRLPATWFVQWSGITAAFAQQLAVAC